MLVHGTAHCTTFARSSATLTNRSSTQSRRLRRKSQVRGLEAPWHCAPTQLVNLTGRRTTLQRRCCSELLLSALELPPDARHAAAAASPSSFGRRRPVRRLHHAGVPPAAAAATAPRPFQARTRRLCSWSRTVRGRQWSIDHIRNGKSFTRRESLGVTAPNTGKAVRSGTRFCSLRFHTSAIVTLPAPICLGSWESGRIDIAPCQHG